MIIFGKIGIGKFFFVECMYCFVIDLKILDEDVFFVFFNCVDYV